MKFTTKKEVEVVAIRAHLGVRYWENAEVNGVEDTDGTLIPLRDGDYWKITIDLKTGKIMDWPEGTTASVHYKVCDDGVYMLLGEGDEVVFKDEGCYVPGILDVSGESYGDYIIFKVDGDGLIEGWKVKELG